MTNEELIAKIKAEIERRIKIQDDWAGRKVLPGRGLAFAVKEELKQLLSFLSTLESEKPMNPGDAMKELDEKIALVKQRGTWDGVDVDKYMDEVRGREPEKPVPADLEKAEKMCNKKNELRYCIEYINPCYPLLDNGYLNVRYLRVPDEHWAEMAITLILSFGGKIYALYRGNVKDGKLADWPTPMIVESEDWFTDEWLHEIMDCGQNCL